MITDLVFLDGHSIEDIMSCFDSSIGIRYQSRNIDMIALAKLGEMLSVSDYKALSNGFNLVSEPDEQMLFSFPTELRDKLIAIADEEISEICEEWKLIEEFRGRMTTNACEDYLKEVREFLNRSNEPVYLHLGA